MALIVAGATVTTGANLNATKLTGNLPEISGADLTNLPAPDSSAVGTSTAGLSKGVVGSYAMLNCSGAGAPTLAGNNAPGTLEYSGCGGTKKSNYGTGADSPSGTWNLRGLVANNDDERRTTICLRTA